MLKARVLAGRIWIIHRTHRVKHRPFCLPSPTVRPHDDVDMRATEDHLHADVLDVHVAKAGPVITLPTFDLTPDIQPLAALPTQVFIVYLGIERHACLTSQQRPCHHPANI
jgi:hypothetical protein